MRRRLVLGTIAVIVAVLVALIPPVIILLRRAAERELEVRLSSQAAAVSSAIADEALSAGTVSGIGEIAQIIPPGDYLEIVESDGVSILQFGNEVSSPITGTAVGPRGTEIRVSTSDDALNRRVRKPLLALGVFAVLSIALGAALAALVGRRLTRPLEALARSADRLGSGDFSASLPASSGIPEIDGIGAALSASARRLDQMLAAERSFTGDATHQLRTGLTGIGLQLELVAARADPSVRADAEEAQTQLDRLTQTLDELLALARGGAGEQRTDVDIRALVAAHCTDWRARSHRRRRSVDVTGASPRWRVTPGFVGQIVDVLLDNALQHGRGTITIELGERTLTVRDEGSIDDAARRAIFAGANTGSDADDDPATRAHGRGLVLARRLARADGGSLELTAATPTTFTLTYPPIR